MPKLTGFPRVNIQGPRPFPLLGHLPRLFQFLDDPIRAVMDLRRHGDIVGIAEGCPALVCVFGPERNREVLSKPAEFRHDEDFIKSPPGSALSQTTKFLVGINGEEHRRHRRLMMPAFSRSALEGYAAEIVQTADHIIDRWPIGMTVDLDTMLRDLALSIAVRTLFGLDVKNGATELGETAAEFLVHLTSPMGILLRVNIPGTPYYKGIKLGDKLLGLLERLIAEKRQSGRAENDALAMLIRAVDEDGSRFSDTELLAEAVTLFVAGHETTAKTLSWTLFLLDRHPEILMDVLDEIDRVLGKRPVTAEDIPRMPLLDRVIRESMRILAPVPTLFLRVAAHPIELGGVMLPQGANVVVSPYATHHDPDLYSQPKQFLPSRWEKLEPSAYEYLPFGAGPRICVGALFAHQSLRLILPTLLQKTRIKVAQNAVISRITRGNILMPRYGIPVRIDRPHRRKMKPEAIRGNIVDMVELKG